MERKNKDLVSVIVPTYNQTDRLSKCIKSLVNQTYLPIEIIIVNDGKVNVKDYLPSLYGNEHVKIKIINNKTNLGACKTRNKGILAAEGNYITLCDDDDFFTPTRVEDLLRELKKNKYRAVFSDSVNQFDNHQKTTRLPRVVDLETILRGNYIGAQFFTKANLMKEVLFDEKFIASQDHDFNTRFIKKFGPMNKVDKASYISVQYEGENRVSKNKLVGRLQFYMKHRDIMSNLNKIIFYLKFGFHLVFKK